MSASATVTTAEGPILFSGPMVRAVMREIDPKTQTRRAIRLPKESQLGVWEPTQVGGAAVYRAKRRGLQSAPPQVAIWHTLSGKCFSCPYGKPGDRLWVRETWRYFGGDEYQYQQDKNSVIYDADCRLGDETERFKPSIHMPRWASRLTLEITEVRVQRLQEISEEDAIAEGISECLIPADDEGPNRLGYMVGPDDGKSALDVSPCDSYRQLWDSINSKRDNGKYAWEKNPWVWAITFRRLP